MPEQMSIREAGKEDLGSLLELYKHLHEIDDPLPSPEVLNKMWAQIMDNPALYYFFVDYEQKPVCSCTLSIIPNLTRGARPYGVIENVITHPDYRGRGFAKAILRHTLDKAWQQGCYKVMLLSSSFREGAHLLYEKVGFNKEDKIGFVAKPAGKKG